MDLDSCSGWIRRIGYWLTVSSNLLYERIISFNVDIVLIILKLNDNVNMWWVELFPSVIGEDYASSLSCIG